VHTVRPQSAHGALEDLTTLPQSPLSELSNTLCKRQAAAFILSMFKTHGMPHSVLGDCTALLATAQRAPRRSAISLNAVCENAVRTPLWCDRGLRRVLKNEQI